MLKRHIYAITSLTILAALSLGASRVRAVPPSSTQNVTVLNTAVNPVPTSAQGTTQVGGTVAVSSLPAVQLSGSPSVSVSSLPAVQMADGSSIAINNPTGSPVPVHDAGPSGQTYISKTVQIDFTDGTFGLFLDSYTVPAGKVLTLKDVSVLARFPNPETGLYAEVMDHTSQNVFQLYCPMTAGGTDSGGSSWFSGALSNCSIEYGAGSIV